MDNSYGDIEEDGESLCESYEENNSFELKLKRDEFENKE